jgi:hypothetical protein
MAKAGESIFMGLKFGLQRSPLARRRTTSAFGVCLKQVREDALERAAVEGVEIDIERRLVELAETPGALDEHVRLRLAVALAREQVRRAGG